jgi:uncharacterized protein YodC (DUF2158 family)
VNLENIEKGMVVRLKSGGPAMTVRAITDTQAYCEWFSDIDRRLGTFDFSSLEEVRDPPTPADQAPFPG